MKFVVNAQVPNVFLAENFTCWWYMFFIPFDLF